MLNLLHLSIALLSYAITFSNCADIYYNHSSVTDPLGVTDSLSLGINCRGSTFCPWFSSPLTRINLYLQEWMHGALADNDIYAPHRHIACVPTGVGTRAYCAFTAGSNIPGHGINGSLVKEKMRELQHHGCFACGSVPLSEDNNPDTMGMLKLDFVWTAECSDLPGRVICDPTTKGAGHNGSTVGN